MNMKKYIVKMGAEGYYKSDSRYRGIDVDQADRLDQADAQRIVSSLKKLGYKNASMDVDPLNVKE